MTRAINPELTDGIAEWREPDDQTFDHLSRGDNFKLRTECCGLTLRGTYLRVARGEYEQLLDAHVPTPDFQAYVVTEPITDSSEPPLEPKMGLVLIREQSTPSALLVTFDEFGFDVHEIADVSEALQ